MSEITTHPETAEIVLLETIGCFLCTLDCVNDCGIETADLYSLISCTYTVVAWACMFCCHIFRDYASPACFAVFYRKPELSKTNK